MKAGLISILVLLFSFSSMASSTSWLCSLASSGSAVEVYRHMTFGTVSFELTADTQSSTSNKQWTSFFDGQITDFEGVQVANMTVFKFIGHDHSGNEIYNVLFRTMDPANKALADWFRENVSPEYDPTEEDVQYKMICEGK